MLAASKPLLRDPSPQVRREIALMLRDPIRADASAPISIASRFSRRAEWLDAMAALASQIRRQGSLVSRSARHRGARERRRALREAEESTSRPDRILRSTRWYGGSVRERRFPTSSRRSTAPRHRSPERTVALDTLGCDAMARSGARDRGVHHLRRRLLRRSSERAFGLYSHQLFSCGWMRGRARHFPAVDAKGLSRAGDAESLQWRSPTRWPIRSIVPDLIAAGQVADGGARSARSCCRSNRRQERRALPADSPGTRGRPDPIPSASPPMRATAHLACREPRAMGGGDRCQRLPNEVRIEAMRLLGGSAPGSPRSSIWRRREVSRPSCTRSRRNLTNYALPPPRDGGRRGRGQSPVAIRAGAARRRPIRRTSRSVSAQRSRCRCRPQKEFPLRSSSNSVTRERPQMAGRCSRPTGMRRVSQSRRKQDARAGSVGNRRGNTASRQCSTTSSRRAMPSDRNTSRRSSR